MKNLSLLLMLMILALVINAQNVGIGTTTPLARLHVTDSAVLFTGPPFLIDPTPFSPPVSGSGTRMMWYPQKAAFRAGGVLGTSWDKDNIGQYSFAAGYGTRAFGAGSVSMGANNAATGNYSFSAGLDNSSIGDASVSFGNLNLVNGKYAMAIGESNWAKNDYSFCGGFQSVASGDYAISYGYISYATGLRSTSFGDKNIASGQGSVAIGGNNKAIGGYAVSLGANSTANGMFSATLGNVNVALGNYSISLGNENTAVADNSLALGTNNVTRGIYSATFGYGNVAQSSHSLVIGSYNDSTLTDKLFEIGNGSFATRSNALTVLRNGNMGIGITNPTNLLTFAAIGGKKISLFPGGTGDAGMGIFPNEFCQYSDNPNADITFGYDSYSTGFSEKVRFKANGMVGIGTATPVLSTGSSGIVAQNNTYIQLRVQSSASAAGMEFKPSTGNQYEIQADNSNNWFVYNRNVNAYRLFINGSGFVGIGTNNPTQALQVVGNILASGTITPSDIRYKKNIQPIQSPIEKLAQLNGVTYKYRKEEFPQMGFTDKEQIGLIAQEVEKVFPQLVVTDNKGYKAVDYVKLVPVLLEGIKVQQSELIQQQSVNRSLQDQIDELKKLISHSEK
jgi:hypothetical protein